MTLYRRKFLHKTFVGFLSLSLLPPAFSILKRFDASSFSVSKLFSQLSFKKGTLSLKKFHRKIDPLESGPGKLKNSGGILYSNETVCIPESNNLMQGIKENFVSVYQNTNHGFQKIVSLNQWELMALHKMLTHLKNEHDISDSGQLRTLLVPVLKTKKHRSQNNYIDGECSSKFGYYTGYGYCSIGILAKGNSMIISTSLLNHRKIERYQNSFILEDFI